MAKKKRSASTQSSKKQSVNKQVVRQIRVLLGYFFVVFLFAAIFNAAGSAGTFLYTYLRMSIGVLTPFYALVLAWYLLRKYFPEKLSIGWVSMVGIFVFITALAGVLHSFSPSQAIEISAGGYVGLLLAGGVISILGKILGQLFLFFLIIVGVLLMANRAVIPYILGEDSEEEVESNEVVAGDKVKVMGEIKLGGMSGLSKLKPGKSDPVQKQGMLARKTTVDAVQVPLRTTNWSYPPTSLLEKIDMRPDAGNIKHKIETIQKTLRDFGVDVTMDGVNIGPTVAQYTMKPADGVKLNLITARQDDLALALAAQSLRVEAPIPGKSLVGVEIPNEKKATVGLRAILDSDEFKKQHARLAIALGLDAAGQPAIADIAKMPHALIAGSTGSGKSVAINSIILTLLMNNSPEELRMILVDPKRVELVGFNGLPHLLTPVITESKDAVAALAWCVREMDRRYKLLGSLGKRNIEQYNADPDLGEGRLPFIVLIIDELADLMLVAAREIEASVVRIAQMARAVGIHLILATQRPSVDVITGLIKANIPTRVAFAVASQIDSRTILDSAGAEKLLGYGDMLYVSTDTGKPRRIQGVYASEREINAVIAHIKMQEVGDRYDMSVLETRVESRLGSSRDGGEVDDELFNEAYEVVKQAGKASSTLLQTRLSVGYARAARLIQLMEDKGLVGPAKGSKPREVYGAGMIDDTDVAGYGEAE